MHSREKCISIEYVSTRVQAITAMENLEFVEKQNQATFFLDIFYLLEKATNFHTKDTKIQRTYLISGTAHLASFGSIVQKG